VPFAAADAAGAHRRVDRMLQSLVHRGPDDTRVGISQKVVFGATRLAIRGVQDGRQPMIDPETGLLVACNGEIDNHQELREWLLTRGRKVSQATDVAVIPGLYLELGEAFLRRLVGAFAVAIWDPRTGRLLLARDRAGERPLFFARTPEGIAFATEIAAIAPDPGSSLDLDQSALRGYLQFGSFVSPNTPFAAIRKVAPAEVVTIDGTEIRRERYWRWGIVETPKRTPTLDGFDEIFRRAVCRQSDVEVDFAVFLSGGLDSSLVASVARNTWPDRRIKAFTLRFDEDSYDEGQYAETVANALGLESVPVWVRPDLVPVGISNLVRLVGEPLADPAWLPTALLAQQAAKDARMALVGEGADELFGGYPTYIGARLAERYGRLPRFLKSALQRFVQSLSPSDKKVTISYLLKRFMAGVDLDADLDGVARHRLWTSNLSPEILHRLGVTNVTAPIETRRSGELLLDLVQRNDLETSLAEGLLTKADRASMSWALELRAPFLDVDVMEFAASLPAAERVRGFSTKHFLKRYALRYLPRQIVYRRKRGLSVPISRWLRGPLSGWAEARLASHALGRAGVDTDAALGLFAEHRRREADHARSLWTLIVLSEWLDWVSEEKPQGAAPPPSAEEPTQTQTLAPLR
jgi:asparagine synthase (glutamine-hydrolysing)